MNRQRKHFRTICLRRLCSATALILMNNAFAFGATIASPSARISAASDKFDGVVQVAAAFEVSEWSFLRTHHIEISVGSILSSNGNAVFASIGPVWRTPLLRGRFFVDLGIAPTLLGSSQIGDRDLGGRFHFTSFASAGMRLGHSSALSLRVQHTSNGGLRRTNPGMDMLGLEFSYRFSE